MPLFRYSLPSLSGVCGVPAHLLLLCPIDRPQATEAWEEQEEKELGFPRLSCALTPHGPTGEDALEKKASKILPVLAQNFPDCSPKAQGTEALRRSPTGNPRPTLI